MSSRGITPGLKDDLLSPEDRIETKRALLAPVERAARNDGLELPQSVSGPKMRGVKSEAGFQMAFLTRMILSCLIDADRTAAATSDAGGDDVQKVDHPSITSLEAVLHEWMRVRVAAPNLLNALRNDVLPLRATKPDLP
jgi:hypothetical protein